MKTGSWQITCNDRIGRIAKTSQKISCHLFDLITITTIYIDKHTLTHTGTDVQVLDNQQELIYCSPVWSHDIVLRICRKQEMIEMNGKRERERQRQKQGELRKSMLAARHDEDVTVETDSLVNPSIYSKTFKFTKNQTLITITLFVF